MIKALGEVVEGYWEWYLESTLGRRSSRCKGPGEAGETERGLVPWEWGWGVRS